MAPEVMVERAAAEPHTLLPPTTSHVDTGNHLGAFECAKIAQEWLNDAEKCLNCNDIDGFANLFVADGWWKDHLLLDLDINSLQPTDFKSYLETHKLSLPKLANLRVERMDEAELVRAAPDAEWVQAYFKLETDKIRGDGVLRLQKDGEEWKAWILHTQAAEIKGHEEFAGPRRPFGAQHGENVGKKNWMDLRREDIAFEQKEPTVLIIGAGQNGLMIAARFAALGIPHLVIEKNRRVGDSWRKRYHSLVLHDPIYSDHFPYMMYPPTAPQFLPKDVVANFMEGYAEAMCLNVWLNSTISPGATYDSTTGRWTIEVVRGEPTTTDDSVYPEGSRLPPTKRTLHPRYLVLATGFSGEPRMPDFPTNDFKGVFCHSSKHEGSVGTGKWKGKRAVVIGCCNSGHDIAQDFYEQGAEEVTMVQRSHTYVMSSEHGLPALLNGYYEESVPLQTGDRLFTSFPISVIEKFHTAACPRITALDRPILDGLEKAGFKVNYYPGSLFMKYFRDGGGYYIDVGASKLIADGKIKVKQGVEVDKLAEDGVVFKDGVTIKADVVVAATGYSSMRDTVKRLIGEHVSSKLGPVWGCDKQGEIPGAWRCNGQPGFYLQCGNFFQARCFSKILALTIQMQELGLGDKEFTGRKEKWQVDPRF